MRTPVLLLLPLALVLGGPTCGSNTVDVRVTFDPPIFTVPASSFFQVDVVVETRGAATVQAWELEVEGKLPHVLPLAAQPHPEFDDDGTLFTTPLLDLGNAGLARIVDVRHGASASGTFRAVTIELFAGDPGQATLRLVAGGLADPAGNALVVGTGSASITVQ